MAVFLAILMCISLLPANTAAADESVGITITFQIDDSGFLLARQTFNIAADLSERYGYEDIYHGDKVTVLDALVAAHIALFGDDNLEEWLESENGFTTKAAGIETWNLVFQVNGESVGNGIYAEDPWNGGTSQTGRLINEAELSDGDDVSFIILQDDWGMDTITWFAADGQKITAMTAAVGQDIELSLLGYMSWYAYSDPTWQARWTEPIEDAAIVSVDIEEAAGIRLGYFGDTLALTGENGQATISFSATGVYIVSAVDDSGWNPLVSPWLEITVVDELPDLSDEDDAKLGNLLINDPDGAPIPIGAFNKNTDRYYLRVDEIDRIIIEPVAFNDNAMIIVNRYGSAEDANNGTMAPVMVPGGDKILCWLKTDPNPAVTVITITVTPPPGSLQNDKTYTLTVNRIANVTVPANALPDRVETFLPAPGQYVNQEEYRDPLKTLITDANCVTLGSYGGSIIYYFADPIKNDPNNPYGIDFIVYGNAFTDASGNSNPASSEPAAVMVSGDGISWYELAGSLYYNSGVRRNISVTYSNPDPDFTGAVAIPWSDSDGNAGTLKTVSLYTQPYYPNPALYGAFNAGAGVNSIYDSHSMTVIGGSMFSKPYSPAYGYGDVHAYKSPMSNVAVNPYIKDHYTIYNGDGMDLAWAVDANGSPVTIDEISYIKIYNPTLFDGASTGECSPEIASVCRAEPDSAPAGRSAGLTALTINNVSIPLTSNIYEYSFNAEGAATISITPTAAVSGANILVNDYWVASGTASSLMLPGEKLRVIVQDGSKEPAIYTITLNGTSDPADSAEIGEISVIPGELSATAGAGNTYNVTIPNSVSGVRVRAVPLNDGAAAEVDGTPVLFEENWLCSSIIPLAAGQTKQVTVAVTSASGNKSESYNLNITRAAESSGSTEPNEISVSFSLTGDTKHGTPGAHSGFITWIPKKFYNVPQNSTVKYLTDRALIENGIPFTTNSNGAYISSINGLAEFDNGPNSGWMYRINGKIASASGYAELVLKTGDNLTWFYTDDYTKETDDYSNANDYGSGQNSASSGAVNPPDIDAGISAIIEEDIPLSDNTIIADWSNPFKDVDTGNWFYNAVRYANMNGLMVGVADGIFSPEEPLTRASQVTILHRSEGTPAISGQNPFNDVISGQWYTNAVIWANSNGIVKGYGGDMFGPNDNMTREQLTAILYRYSIWRGLDVSATTDLSSYADTGSISPWAKDALEWAVASGLMLGRGADELAPQSFASRAEAATLLMRYFEQ